MRVKQILDNRVTIKYPDETAFVFSPLIVDINTINYSGKIGKARLAIGTYAISYRIHGNQCTIDYRELAEAHMRYLRAQNGYVRDYQSGGITCMGKREDAEIQLYDRDTNAFLAIFRFSTFYQWGELYEGETLDDIRRLVMFKGYPFSYGITYGYNADDDNAEINRMLIYKDGKFNAIRWAGEGEGVYTEPLPAEEAKKWEIYIFYGEYAPDTFDETFDETFQQDNASKLKKRLQIDVADVYYEHPVYLRWIDRRGYICHWLFREGSRTLQSKETGEYIRDNITGDIWRNRTSAYTRRDTLEICAPLTSKWQRDILESLTTSPIIDMWTGGDEWVPVSIAEGSYTIQTDIPLQDFVCEIKRNEHNTQKL